MSNVFAKIIAGELPAEKIFENDNIIAIKDINPVAPVHLLIMPKKAINSIQEITTEDMGLISEIIQTAQQLAKYFGCEDNYRLLTNNGKKAGQTIFHLHFHLIGGKWLGPMA